MHGNSFERRLSIVKHGVKPRADVRFSVSNNDNYYLHPKKDAIIGFVLT